MILPWATIFFFCIAIMYSSVGFGGGSSYIALLFVSQVSYEYIPSLALICNLIVVTGGAYHYIKNGHLNWKFIFPFIITSIPMAFLGGSIPIDKSLFKIILGVCLFLAGIRMIFFKKNTDYQDCHLPPLWASLFLGAGLGFVSGLVGIGGGIFLSPILFNLKWGKPKQIAAICCLFIFFNSFAGLIGQVQKLNDFTFITDYWPLLIAVFIGGQVGSFIGATKLKPRLIELGTACLVLIVSGRILLS